VVEILRSQQLHGQRAREIGSKLRLRGAQTRDEAQATVLQITGELAGLAEKTAGKAEKLLVNAAERCAGHGPRPPSSPRSVATTPSPVAGGVGCAGRRTTWPTCWGRPDGLPRRPANACPTQNRTGRSAE
jgi:hypothetical protein